MRNVYAQRTSSNERICSLMSAVLQRNIDARFSRAIMEKSRQSAPTASHRGGVPTVVFVRKEGCEKECARTEDCVSSMCCNEGVGMIAIQVNDGSPWQETRQAIQERCPTRCFVLWTCFSGCNHTMEYLSNAYANANHQQEREQWKHPVGIVAIGPDLQEIAQEISMPMLILSASSLGSRRYRAYQCNPSVILVVDYLLGMEGHSDGQTEDPISIWIARTIIKYAGAISVVQGLPGGSAPAQQSSNAIVMRSRL